MTNQAYIEAHELYTAYTAISLGAAGFAELETFHAYDIEPLADDLEAQVIDAINDQADSEYAYHKRKQRQDDRATGWAA